MGIIVYLAVTLIIITVFILTRLYLLKKEIKRAGKQLHELNKGVTEKKLDLAFFDKDIENLVKEINQQIDVTKQANAEKRRKENELKQAIANISHDIRTPMTSILGYIQFLESDELSSEKKAEYTSVVKGGALRLKALLEDFFELSIIESADYPLKPEKMVLNHLLLEVLVGFYEQFNQQGVEPALQIPEEEISIIGDVSAVKRVIENLVVNAIKHSKGNISIRLKKLPAAVQLIISNQVDQLNEQDIHYLFDRFYKGDKTRTEKSTGLGLAIAKSLMTKMRGNLTAHLKENELSMVCEWKIR
ncbi:MULTISPECIES: sensor histidine kinase [unclassified Cytobacillus]|uniref:sensor histidine kinase n=1 Tax=unclassified Cytobacillus TaxID=2675268 RepID=UPI0028895413|nr:HAMP domain-containing sensor histidine kinase [Cytobacillus sp. AMY 15.2]